MPPTAPSDRRVRSLEQLEHEVHRLIRRVKRMIGERARSVHPDLQPASYLMLMVLAGDGPQRSSALSERMGVDKGAISRQVQHLEQLGLLSREPDPADGRAALVSATPEAVRRLEAADRARRRGLGDKLAHWSVTDLSALVDSLTRYNDSLD